MPIAIKDYIHRDASELAHLIKTKEVSADELLETAVALTEALNPRLNAIVTPMYEEAKQQIKSLNKEAPLAGVPFLLKDLGSWYQGVVTSNGSRFFQDFVPDLDSETVQRFKKAGLIILGKTNTPELGLSFTTEPQLFGPCKNPWDLTRTPGGSSGGSAAAVAARIVPLAHAGDGGGSIRVPAACCGLLGLKPTRARVPLGPAIGEGWSGLVTQLGVTMTVRDCATLLDAIAGYELGDPYVAPATRETFLSAIAKQPSKLRIAVSTDLGTGISIHPSCIAAIMEAAKLFESLGHYVEEARPHYEAEVMTKALHTIISANSAMIFGLHAEALSRDIQREEIEPNTWLVLEESKRYSAKDYARAIFDMHAQSRFIASFFQDYDILLTPTTAQPPLALGSIKENYAHVTQFYAALSAFAPFTSLWNQTGQPAISIPLHWTADRLPIGIQLISAFGNEALLLQLAHVVEKLKPWRKNLPPLLLPLLE
jgi:Asp-tRNA(Asn)/Glu-tRNA(Gln) amidotransferase A subunit family amidase